MYFHPFAISCAGFHSVMVNKYRCEVMQPLVGSSMLSFHLNSRKTRLQRGFCPFNLFVERLDCAISLSNRRTKSFSSKVVRFFIVNHKNSVKNRKLKPEICLGWRQNYAKLLYFNQLEWVSSLSLKSFSPHQTFPSHWSFKSDKGKKVFSHVIESSTFVSLQRNMSIYLCHSHIEAPIWVELLYIFE